MTSKPPSEPVVRALTDESELDEEVLAAIVGGTGAPAASRGGSDSWSRAVQDPALVISAGTSADRVRDAATQPPAPSPQAPVVEQRALLPERAGDAPLPEQAAPIVGGDVDDKVSALFDTSVPKAPPKADDSSDQNA